MKEYIEREVAKKEFGLNFGSVSHAVIANRILDALPAADVVERKRGRWVMTLYATTSKRGRVIANKKFACSECGYGNGRKKSNFCSDCGADMREV